MTQISLIADELQDIVGGTYFESDWHVVDRDHLEKFSYSIYLDPAYVNLTASKNNPLGPELVDGFLLLSLLVYFRFRFAPKHPGISWGLNYGLDRVRFIQPVYIDQRMKLRSTLLSASEHSDALRLATRDEIFIEDRSKPAMSAEWITLSYQSREQ